jgi:hypothetical protein
VSNNKCGKMLTMTFERFLAQTKQQGKYDSTGAIRLDLAEMRAKLKAQFRGEIGLWLVCLLQSMAGADIKKVTIDLQPGQLLISFHSTTGEYPTPGRFAPFLTETKTGSGKREWDLLRALLGLPPEMRFAWSGEDGTLKRSKEGWSFVEEKRNKRRNLIHVQNTHIRDNWNTTLATVRYRFPLPPFPLYINGQKSWKRLESGGKARLLFGKTVEGNEFFVDSWDISGRFDQIHRLGLEKEPSHRITFLQNGARVHEHKLDLETRLLSTEVFVSGQDLPVDLSGFSVRQSAETEALYDRYKKLVLSHLRDTFSNLISRPKLPTYWEEERRKESLVGSAVALGGLSFLQIPFFHPLLTLGATTLVLGGVGIRTMLKGKAEPWRGETGMRQVRRDLVEARKQIDSWVCEEQ